jgi:hypothetical protein
MVRYERGESRELNTKKLKNGFGFPGKGEVWMGKLWTDQTRKYLSIWSEKCMWERLTL